MKKNILRLIVLFSLLINTVASAHTGMADSSVLHNAIHIMISVGVYLAIMGVGFYFYRKLPKAQRQKVRRRDKR